MSIPKNHTPHDIIIYKDGNVVASFPPSTPILRLTQTTQSHTHEIQLVMGNNSITIASPPQYVGLSDAVSGDILVSQLVAQWLVDHPDVQKFHGITSIYSPDTGPGGVVRNEKGEIIGTKKLIKYA